MTGQTIKDVWVLHLDLQADTIQLLTLISYLLNEDIHKVKMQISKSQQGK